MNTVALQSSEVWDAISAVTGVGSTIVAAFSAYFALATVRTARAAAAEQGAIAEHLVQLNADSARENSREQTANETYDKYLQLCIQYPDFASYDIAATIHKFSSPEEVWHFGTKESERYLWFLSYALNAFERILVDGGGSEDEAWIAAIKDQIRFHRQMLKVLWVTDFQRHYSKQLDEIVRSALNDKVWEALDA